MRRKKAGEMECKRNVNKPYRIVNQKTEKSPKRQDTRQFTHSSTASYIYIYILYFIFIYYYRVTFPPSLFASFRALQCYSMPFRVNCFSNVTASYGHGEVMGGPLTNLSVMFLALFECKQQ